MNRRMLTYRGHRSHRRRCSRARRRRGQHSLGRHGRDAERRHGGRCRRTQLGRRHRSARRGGSRPGSSRSSTSSPARTRSSRSRAGGGGTASPTPSPTSTSPAVQQSVGQDQGGRDVVQRRAGRPGAGRVGRRVHRHRRLVRRRDVQGHRRRARERGQVASPSISVRPCASRSTPASPTTSRSSRSVRVAVVAAVTSHSITVLSVTSQNGTALVTHRGGRQDVQRSRAGRRDQHVLGRDPDHRHQRERPDRHHPARRSDADAARGPGDREVSLASASHATDGAAAGRPVRVRKRCVRWSPRAGRTLYLRAERG